MMFEAIPEMIHEVIHKMIQENTDPTEINENLGESMRIDLRGDLQLGQLTQTLKRRAKISCSLISRWIALWLTGRSRARVTQALGETFRCELGWNSV